MNFICLSLQKSGEYALNKFGWNGKKTSHNCFFISLQGLDTEYEQGSKNDDTQYGWEKVRNESKRGGEGTEWK